MSLTGVQPRVQCHVQSVPTVSSVVAMEPVQQVTASRGCVRATAPSMVRPVKRFARRRTVFQLWECYTRNAMLTQVRANAGETPADIGMVPPAVIAFMGIGVHPAQKNVIALDMVPVMPFRATAAAMRWMGTLRVLRAEIVKRDTLVPTAIFRMLPSLA